MAVMLTARARTPAAPPPRPSADDSRSSDLLTYMLACHGAPCRGRRDAAAAVAAITRELSPGIPKPFLTPKRLFLVQERARQDGLQGFDVVGSVGWGC